MRVYLCLEFYVRSYCAWSKCVLIYHNFNHSHSYVCVCKCVCLMHVCSFTYCMCVCVCAYAHIFSEKGLDTLTYVCVCFHSV